MRDFPRGRLGSKHLICMRHLSTAWVAFFRLRHPHTAIRCEINPVCQNLRALHALFTDMSLLTLRLTS